MKTITETRPLNDATVCPSREDLARIGRWANLVLDRFDKALRNFNQESMARSLVVGLIPKLPREFADAFYRRLREGRKFAGMQTLDEYAHSYLEQAEALWRQYHGLSKDSEHDRITW